MLEQVLDNQKLMQEGIELRIASLETSMREGFASLEARITALERTVAEHSRKIDALHGMILDNREAIEANRAEIEAVKKLLEEMDDRLTRQLEPRVARVEARVDEIERILGEPD